MGLFKKKPKDKEKEKNREKQEKDLLKGASSNKILIRVFKHFGSNVSFLKAEYEAIEKRDIYNNLISINADYSHNEDTDFTIDDVYREMQIILEFKNMPKDKRITLLDEKITNIDKTLAYLKKFPELNCMHNFADLSVQARDYKILRNYTKNHDDSGAYFMIEKDRRVYSFESVDGFLVPIWHGVDTYTQYPDHTRKVKITIQEDQRMREEMKAFNREKTVHSLMIWGLIMLIILFGLNVYAGLKLYQKHSEIDQQLHLSAFTCAEYTSRVNQEITTLLDNAVIKDLIQKAQEQHNEVTSVQPTQTTLDPEHLLNTVK